MGKAFLVQGPITQTFGENACHPEGNEGSGSAGGEILRFPQDDRRDLLQARSQVAVSPNDPIPHPLLAS
jgi:hypothetical protein